MVRLRFFVAEKTFNTQKSSIVCLLKVVFSTFQSPFQLLALTRDILHNCSVYCEGERDRVLRRVQKPRTNDFAPDKDD